MAIETDVWNMALAHIGVKKRIASASLGANSTVDLLIAFSQRALNDLKRRHQWQAFSVYETLALVKESPNDHYAYAYLYPKDCLFFRKILSGIRNDHDDSRVPFGRGRIRDDKNNLVSVIFTDHSSPCGLYTEKSDDITEYDDDFALAWSYRLAYFIAPGLTGGDPFKIQKAALENFRSEFSNARKMDLSERQIDKRPKSNYERARNSNNNRRIDGEVGFLAPINSVIT